MIQEFAIVDVVRLQVQEGWPDLPNEIGNPSGDIGAWGWTVQGFGDATSVRLAPRGTTGFRASVQTATSAVGGVAARYEFAIASATAGHQIRGAVTRISVAGAPTAVYADVTFWNSTTFDTMTGELVPLEPATRVLLPANAVTAIPAHNVPLTTEIITIDVVAEGGAGTAVEFGDVVLMYGLTADIAASDPLTEPAWIDVLGSAATISVERDELNVGILNATLIDSTLDPAETDLIRPGKRVRLETEVDGVWEALFTGKLDNPSTAYVVDDPDLPDVKRVRISLVGSDAVADLANAPRSEGVSTLAELPYVLLGTGVPFNVNGSQDAIDPTSVVVVTRNDQAKAVDQIAITRDTVLGYAWVDRCGVLQVWDADQIETLYPIELANGDFETNVLGWTGGGATLDRNTTSTQAGAGALRLTTTVAGTITARTPTGTAGIPVVPNALYRLEAYSRRAAAALSRSSRVSFRWYDAAGAVISATNGIVTANTTAYVLREVEGTAPANAAFLTLSLEVLAAALTEQHSFDTVRLYGPRARLADDVLSDVAADFDIERTFNTLNIEVLRIDPGTGETESVQFGPYVDEAAIREWRQREALFKVQGIDESTLPAYAAEILSRNAVPEKRINTASIPIRALDDIADYALLDLYDLVGLSSDAANVDPMLTRVTTIKHRLTIKREGASLVGRWWVDLGFTTDGSVAPPQVTPSPTLGGGALTLGELLRPVGEVTMWFGNKDEIPAGWLPCDGAAFSSTEYPKLAALFDEAGFAHFTPDMTDRFPIGAGSKLWSSSGGSVSATLTEANLPSHTHGAGTLATGTGGSAHSHVITRKTGTGSSTGVARGSATADTDATTATDGTHTHGVTGATAGGAGTAVPVTVLNPWRALWFIIRGS